MKERKYRRKKISNKDLKHRSIDFLVGEDTAKIFCCHCSSAEEAGLLLSLFFFLSAGG